MIVSEQRSGLVMLGRRQSEVIDEQGTDTCTYHGCRHLVEWRENYHQQWYRRRC